MRRTLEIINELRKKGIIRDYAIGGAVAALKWVEPFFTRDLDIFVIPLQETNAEKVISFLPIYESLKTMGYDQWTGQWLLIEGVPVEFLPAEGLAREAVGKAVEVEYDGIKTKVATPEYLIALFLKAGREKDKIKIDLLWKQATIDRTRLWDILERHHLKERWNALYPAETGNE